MSSPGKCCNQIYHFQKINNLRLSWVWIRCSDNSIPRLFNQSPWCFDNWTAFSTKASRIVLGIQSTPASTISAQIGFSPSLIKHTYVWYTFLICERMNLFHCNLYSPFPTIANSISCFCMFTNLFKATHAEGILINFLLFIAFFSDKFLDRPVGLFRAICRKPFKRKS